MLVLLIALSYILGAVPFGYVFGRVLKGIDIRRYGSGNFGATNVFRVVGPLAGIAVLILDILKGLIPVIMFGNFLMVRLPELDPIFGRLVLAIAAVCGHNWTVFLKFKGGKGVATTAGALLGLSFKIPSLGLIAGLCLGIWVLVLLATGIVSLSSLIAAVALPIFMVFFHQPLKLVTFAIVVCLFAVYRHKSNIYRLLRGEEKRLFEDAKH